MTDATGEDRTELQILDAAERQFGAHGYAGAKVRAIALESGANLGSFHYYFGSKAALFRAVCERSLGPIMGERIRRFALLEGAAPMSVEAVVRASLEPAMLPTSSEISAWTITRLFYARALVDPAREVRDAMAEVTGPAAARFAETLAAACPHLCAAEFELRATALKGAAIHLLSRSDLLPVNDSSSARREQIERLVAALTAMMLAPPLSESALNSAGPVPRIRSVNV